jgi:pyridoxamine 5'-phosphate oxidase family protein
MTKLATMNARRVLSEITLHGRGRSRRAARKNPKPASAYAWVMSAFTELEITYLASQKLGRVATSQPDGTLQVSPVGFRYNPELDSIDIAGHGMATSRKFRNVADNGRVAFVVDDLASLTPYRPRCLEIRGTAETVDHPAAGALIRIDPKRIISFGIEEEFTSARDVVVNSRNVN